MASFYDLPREILFMIGASVLATSKKSCKSLSQVNRNLRPICLSLLHRSQTAGTPYEIFALKNLFIKNPDVANSVKELRISIDSRQIQGIAYGSKEYDKLGEALISAFALVLAACKNLSILYATEDSRTVPLCDFVSIRSLLGRGLSSFTTLRSLSTSIQNTEKDFDNLCSMFPEVETMSLTIQFEKPPSETTKMQRSARATYRVSSRKAPVWKRLRSLTLDREYSGTEVLSLKNVTFLLRRCPRLRTLDLPGIGHLRNEVVGKMEPKEVTTNISNLFQNVSQTLESVILSAGSAVSPDINAFFSKFLRVMFKTCRNIEYFGMYLDPSDVQRVLDALMESSTRDLPRLSRINFLLRASVPRIVSCLESLHQWVMSLPQYQYRHGQHRVGAMAIRGGSLNLVRLDLNLRLRNSFGSPQDHHDMFQLLADIKSLGEDSGIKFNWVTS